MPGISPVFLCCRYSLGPVSRRYGSLTHREPGVGVSRKGVPFDPTWGPPVADRGQEEPTSPQRGGPRRLLLEGGGQYSPRPNSPAKQKPNEAINRQTAQQPNSQFLRGDKEGGRMAEGSCCTWSVESPTAQQPNSQFLFSARVESDKGANLHQVGGSKSQSPRQCPRPRSGVFRSAEQKCCEGEGCGGACGWACTPAVGHQPPAVKGHEKCYEKDCVAESSPTKLICLRNEAAANGRKALFDLQQPREPRIFV